MEKKKYILLLCLSFGLIIVGLIINYRLNKPPISSEEQLYNSIASGELMDDLLPTMPDMDKYIYDEDGNPVSYLMDSKTDENGQRVNTFYDYSQVPIKCDGVLLRNNLEWLEYYCECRHSDACTITENNVNRNVNVITINGTNYRIPFDIEKLPDDGVVTDLPYCIINNSERFYGNMYARYDNSTGTVYGNYYYVQTYPNTTMVNAVTVEDKGMMYQDTISLEIAGVNVGMTEKEVKKKLGEGTPSNNHYARWFQEKYGIKVKKYQSTVYVNDTGIIVVTYDDKRKVSRLSFYTAALRRDIAKEVLIEKVEEPEK